MTTSKDAPFVSSFSAQSRTLKTRKIKRNHLEASAVSRSVLSHLGGRRFRFGQIPRGAHNLRTVRGERPCGFHTEPSRNPCY
jgi:hypothetical protein